MEFGTGNHPSLKWFHFHIKISAAMPNFLPSVILWIAAFKIVSASEPKPLTSKIENVTVFLNGAQVSRTAATTLSPGTTYLVFNGVSANINTQSIQVRGEGNFTVLSVSHQLNFLKEQEKARETADLEEKQRDLREQMEVENTMLGVYQQEESLLLENKKLGSQQQAVKMTDLKEAADFFRLRLSEIKKKQRESTQAIRRLQGREMKLNAQLAALHNQKNQPTSEITVAVSCKNATNARLILSYLVNDAGWRPTYDVRVKDVSSPIAIIYKANVFQNSGEDWQNVKLVVSTGNPSQGGSRPILEPWYLGYNAAQVRHLPSVSGRVVDADGTTGLPGVNVAVKGTTIGTVTDANGYYSVQLPSNATFLTVSFIGYQTQELPITNPVINVDMLPDTQALNEVVVVGYGASNAADSELQGRMAGVQMSRDKKEKPKITPLVATQQVRQTNVEFKIDIPYTIPADGKQYAVDMQEYAAPAYYEYYCAPKLDNDAFLTAKITDWEAYNLLEGEANLFFEGTFLGKSLLDVQNTGDTLTLSLGRDKNITVTRTKGKDFSKRQLLGANQKDTRSWEINVRNKKNQPVNLVLEDQFPVANTKDIEVERLETSGGETDKETGKVIWKLALPAAQNKKLNLSYSVKYPKGRKVVLE